MVPPNHTSIGGAISLGALTCSLILPSWVLWLGHFPMRLVVKWPPHWRMWTSLVKNPIPGWGNGSGLGRSSVDDGACINMWLKETWDEILETLRRAGNGCAIVGNSATPGYVNLPSISWKFPWFKNLSCLEGQTQMLDSKQHAGSGSVASAEGAWGRRQQGSLGAFLSWELQIPLCSDFPSGHTGWEAAVECELCC